MKKEEIAKYAKDITYSKQVTILHFEDGSQYHGFFEANPIGEAFDTAQNLWNFIRFNDGENFKVSTKVDGNKIVKIELRLKD